MRMNPKVKDYRQHVADAFVESLEKKTLDWKRGWNAVSGIQSNALTGKSYRGINQLYLYIISQEKGYTDSRWATFKQIQDKGWKLQKGAKGEKIEYWIPFDEKEKKFITWGEYRYLRAQNPDADLEIKIYPQYYTVFNGKFIEGLEPLPDLSSNEIPPLNDIVVKASASMGVEILNDGGDRAFYSPAEDRIHLPEQQAFVSEYEYNVTALHELTHATAAANRLNRPLDHTFGSQAYAYEELVAELGSAFMGAHLPIEQTKYHIDNHAAYVQAWIQGIKKEPDVLIRAIREAERAADYLEYHAGLLPLAEAEKNNSLSFEVKDEAVQEENRAIQQSNNQEKATASLGRLEFFTLRDQIIYHSSPEEAIKQFAEAQKQGEVCTLGFHFPEIESKRFAMFTTTQQGISSVDNLAVLTGQHSDVKRVAEQIEQYMTEGQKISTVNTNERHSYRISEIIAINEQYKYNALQTELEAREISRQDHAINQNFQDYTTAELREAAELLNKRDVVKQEFSESKSQNTEFRDLSNRMFSGVDFSNKDFRNYSFEGSQFEHCKFKDTDLSGCDFDNAVIRDCDFVRTNLTDTKFQSAELLGIRFQESSLIRTNFEKASLRKCVLHGESILENLNLTNCRISDVNFASVVNKGGHQNGDTAQIAMPGATAGENMRYRENVVSILSQAPVMQPSGKRELSSELRGKVKSMQAAGKFFELNSKGGVKVPEGADKWLSPAEIDSVSSYIKDKTAEKGKARHQAIGCDCEP